MLAGITHSTSNIASVLKAEISRISLKESRVEVKKLRAMVGKQRKDLAALKQHVASLAKSVTPLQRENLSKAYSAPLASSVGTSSNGRSVTDGVKFTPAKLTPAATRSAPLMATQTAPPRPR